MKHTNATHTQICRCIGSPAEFQYGEMWSASVDKNTDGPSGSDHKMGAFPRDSLRFGHEPRTKALV